MNDTFPSGTKLSADQCSESPISTTNVEVIQIRDDGDDDDIIIIDDIAQSDTISDSQPQPTTVLRCQQELNGSFKGETKHKRKRNTSDADKECRMRMDTNTTIEDQLFEFKNSSHSLQISASSVAALCGLHPYQNLPQLLFDLVYQSHYGQLLLQNDAQALGLSLVDAKTHEQETMLSIASSVSARTTDLIQQVLEVSEGGRTLHSIEEVQLIQQQIKAEAMLAHRSGKITEQQVETLLESSRGHVSTGFGTCHEEEALDVYEKLVGERVRERNEALMEWQFQRLIVNNGSDLEMSVTASPIGKARRRDRDCTESISSLNESTPPFFLIVGAVDGIRDELYIDSSRGAFAYEKVLDNCNGSRNSVSNTGENVLSDNDEDQWSIRSIVVECKHRMKNVIVPPPIYDQIQTSLYCQMYNVDEADLIQVVRRKSNGPRKLEAAGKETEKNLSQGEGNNVDISVTRVSLDDPIYKHRYHWNATLLPRLASFVDAVYRVRRDDSKRYRLLYALLRSQQCGVSTAHDDEESWRVLWDECHWMRDCETAYEHKRRWIESKKGFNDHSLS